MSLNEISWLARLAQLDCGIQGGTFRFQSADWYVCGGRPELHGADYRDCPAPSSGVKGNENENSN